MMGRAVVYNKIESQNVIDPKFLSDLYYGLHVKRSTEPNSYYRELLTLKIQLFEDAVLLEDYLGMYDAIGI